MNQGESLEIKLRLLGGGRDGNILLNDGQVNTKSENENMINKT